MRTIPVDLILHELASRLAELPDTQHRDLHRAISRGCIRPQPLAEQWTSGAGVAQQAAWLVRRLDGEDMTTPRLRELAAETRAMEVAVARRLADCALSLLVTQDTEDASAAQTLLRAAQRVVGLATAKPSAEEARLRHYLAATRCALGLGSGLGSGPVHLGDIVARARSLADADKARHAAEVENANKASVIAKQESIITNLTRERDTWSAWATKLAGQGHEQSSAKALREALSARLIDSKGQRLKVARECLPPNVDIIVCMRGNDPATYKASNTDVEYDTPEAAARAAWEHHQRPISNRAFKVGDRVRFVRRVGEDSQHKDAPPLGWEGVIDEDDESELPLRVVGAPAGDDGAHAWWFIGEALDLITPTA